MAPGGKYLAARITGIGPDFLEIIDADDGQILMTLPDFEIESNLLWTTDTTDMRLVFAIEDPVSLQDHHGAIIAIPVSQFLTPGEQLLGDVLVGFNEAEWGSRGPSYLALSADDSKLVYTIDGDLWGKNLEDASEAFQLTTGPTGNSGPAFSPDGSYVAFMGGRYLSGADTMIVPYDGTGPYFVDLDDPAATQAYMLDVRSLVDGIMAWLP